MSLGLAVNYTDAMKRVFPMRSVWYKLIHNLVGLLGYAIGIISLCYAYYTNWFIYYTGEASRMVALSITIVASFWTINGAMVSTYNQIKSVIS
ncbi:hypothetical protein NQ314_018226 [Rhamnusium bicolor]|uniref:Cytochrome b561 domain-containing protein n=1 Tax=Rhamnusium bicolor TaxID=1586634 RepID=A0AAV8WSG9_9CUCU|nr:hypothetical protein NQ314_018226 [Rhamnusium bicolor]